MVPTSWLANVKFEAERDTAGIMPSPVKLITCGLPAALSLIVSVAVLSPVNVGLKVRPTVQVLAGAIVAPEQASVTFVKSPASVPPSMALLMVKVADPALVKIRSRAALVVPTI